MVQWSGAKVSRRECELLHSRHGCLLWTAARQPKQCNTSSNNTVGVEYCFSEQMLQQLNTNFLKVKPDALLTVYCVEGLDKVKQCYQFLFWGHVSRWACCSPLYTTCEPRLAVLWRFISPIFLFFFQFIYIHRIWWWFAHRRPPVSAAISAAISAACCFSLYQSSNTKVFSVHTVVACYLWQPRCVYIHEDFAHSPAVGFLSSPVGHVKVTSFQGPFFYFLGDLGE